LFTSWLKPVATKSFISTFDAAFDYGAFGEGGVVGSSARLEDLDKAHTILWFGPDPKEELPVLYLRLREAVQRGATLLVAHPRRISLCDFGTHLAYAPGREAELVRGLGRGDHRDGTRRRGGAVRDLPAHEAPGDHADEDHGGEHRDEYPDVRTLLHGCLPVQAVGARRESAL